jgi:hypothetical protein
MSEAAANIVAMLEQTSRGLNLPIGPATDRELATNNCQAFFRAFGNQLQGEGATTWVNDFPGERAAAIVADIELAASRRGGKWREVPVQQTQDLANQGWIVIGAQSEVDGYGHLGIVSPIPSGIDVNKFSGSGPFVRDGNEHQPGDKVYPSTYGAVKASKAFVPSKTKWYVWLPSKPD